MPAWFVMIPLSAAVMVMAAMIVFGKMRAEKVLRDRLRTTGREMVALTATKLGRNEPTIRTRETTASPTMVRIGRFVGYDGSLARDERLGWPVIVGGCLVAAVIVFWRGRLLLGDTLGLVAALVFALVAMRFMFARQRRTYTEALFKQLPDALGLMIRAVQAGVPLSEALRSVSREMPEPTKSEFGRVVGAISIGRTVDQAVWTLYYRTKVTEYSYLAVTLGLQSQTGGSLAETLANLADMIRKRVAIASRAKALAAESKVSATIMSALPFLAGAALSFLQPGYLDTFMNTTLGFNLLMAALVLVAFGTLVMRWLTAKAMRD